MPEAAQVIHNLRATAAPTAANSWPTWRYGALWVVPGMGLYMCEDDTPGAAVWPRIADLSPPGPDPIVGQRLADPSIWTVTRSTAAYVRNAAGVLAPAPADTIAWDFDPTTFAPKGPAFAGPAQNLHINPRFEGGTPGVIGSGGVLPSGLSFSNGLPGGLSTEFMAAGLTADGQPYFSLRYFGTTSEVGSVRLLFLIPNGTVFVSGERIYHAIGYALTGGTLAGFTGGTSIRYTGINPVNTTPDIPLPSSMIQRVLRSTPLTGGTVGSGAGVEFRFTVDAGMSVDATITFYLPNIQRKLIGSTPLPPIGTTGASAEAQTSVDIPIEKLGMVWNHRKGTLIVGWDSRSGAFSSAADADWFGLISWGDKTADNRMGLVVSPSHNTIQARMTAGGAVNTASSVTITAPGAGEVTTALLTWDLDAVSPGNGYMQVCARGVAGTKVPITSLPVPGWMMLARYGTTNPGFIHLPTMLGKPTASFDATGAALTG